LFHCNTIQSNLQYAENDSYICLRMWSYRVTRKLGNNLWTDVYLLEMHL
jgi:hypothetical protein